MKQTAKFQIRQFFRAHPDAKDADLVSELHLNANTVKAEISKMNKTGQISIERNGESRFVTVNFEEINQNGTFKREALETLAEQLIDANRHETNATEIRENGKLLIRILEKL